ncbi:MAG TPA: hypothetical protein VFK05_32495 [Polyangiaceae bacterium]|nr:hypothetical protein [Polyangiaceae bacterium]
MDTVAARNSVSGNGKPLARARAESAATAQTGNALTVVVPVLEGHEQALSELLNDIGTHIRNNAYVDFSKFGTVHFLRWVVLPKASPSAPALLAFECNHDGSREELLRELFSKAPTLMRAIYGHCQGYPSGATLAPETQFLTAHALPYCAFYVGVPGASVKQIRGEQAIRNRIEGYLGARGGPSGEVSARALYDGARGLIQNDPELGPVLKNASDRFPFHPLRFAAGVLAGLSAVPALVPALFALRVKEHFDVQSPSLSIPDDSAALLAREDLQVQNQLTHVVSLKPGPLRSVSTRVVLGVIDFLAHELFTRGNLGGITSIHFARWVLIDEGKRLLFFSNYDGSWESYLGDFIDRASLGLTSVWSNTEGFPKSVFLAFKGATDEERFKAWTRAHQVTTQLWYSAYPDLTVHNILGNRKICAELARGLDSERALQRWLGRF